MASITTWTRLEPRAREPTVDAGLAAAVEDPLFLLGRQWQLGAFQAEDAGSPVAVTISATTAKLSRYHAGTPPAPGGTAPGVPYDGSVPLETLVEAEAPDRGAGEDLRFAARAGLRFLAELDAAGAGHLAGAFLDAYRLRAPASGAPVDAATARFAQVMTGRAPDGHALRAALRPPGTAAGDAVVPADPPVADPADRNAVQTAAIAWLAWVDALAVDPPGDVPWVNDRLEYEASVAAAGPGADETVLVAPEYPGGHLDWWSFDVAPRASLGAAGDGAPGTIARTMLPTRVGYRGMPSARWFELEDAEVNFGAVTAGPPDLARLLLLHFACLYGDDHFVVPLTLEVGSLCRIDALTVTNAFGDRTEIAPASQVDAGGAAWRLWEPSVRGSKDSAPLLMLAPVLGPSLEGTPVEEVRLVRDEMANVVWGIERAVEGPLGTAVDRVAVAARAARRVELAAGGPQPPPPAVAGTAPRAWRLQTDVPEHWVPLLPVRVGDRLNRLRLHALLDAAGQPVLPRSRLLREGSPPALELWDEEVPRAGVHVRRAWQHARWTDGSTVLWLGRRRTTGRGEGWSGLRFDTLDRMPPPT